MFDAQTYKNRRKELQQKLTSGLVLFLSNNESPMNYADNIYHYRQDSTFLYYFGLDMPNITAIMDIDNDEHLLFGDELTLDDIVWMGPQPSLKKHAERAGLRLVHPNNALESFIHKALDQGRKIHFLNPYRAENAFRLSTLLGIERDHLSKYASGALTRAVICQRSLKTSEEIEQIELAQTITYEMQTAAMRMAKPGLVEREISGFIEGVALAQGCGVSFPVILSVHGEILHNHSHNNTMQDGDLLINDCGAESLMHYAADITRTIPVSAKFNPKQKAVYEIVLNAQTKAIEAIKPGVLFRDIHLKAARIIADGLKDLGLMKGDMGDAVSAGAHALFFPHGLGHMMGLDVHDMENLGENYVGYDNRVKRSEQFGLAYLRLGKALETGYVVTVEPGLYFIPELINKWQAENKFTDFIIYDKLTDYMDFGGVRIEDDILVTDDGFKEIGKPIPKTVADVEEMCRRSE